MPRLFAPPRFAAAVLFVLVWVAAEPRAARAWGNEGHRIINRLAASTLPADVPAFLHSQTALDEIEYLGPEPDRWRSPAEPELNAAQAPEHFIDLELADALGPLPHRRLDFEAAAFAAGRRPEKIGLQPWEATEIWERLKAALREYRRLAASPSASTDTGAVEQAVLFYAGWLGHYVGDGSNPMHTSIQYNGWVGPNPKGYTTSHDVHSKMETAFVNANPEVTEIAALMHAPRRLDHPFEDYLAYLRESQSKIERAYELEKTGGFDGHGGRESREFIRRQLAHGAQMLLDMWYTAWINSAQEPSKEY
jgi:hypothetical protein